jgi:hypothetical protein
MHASQTRPAAVIRRRLQLHDGPQTVAGQRRPPGHLANDDPPRWCLPASKGSCQRPTRGIRSERGPETRWWLRGLCAGQLVTGWCFVHDRISWRAPRASPIVDPAIVASPAQAQVLLGAVARIRPELAAFFGCLYYAALRPEEAIALRSCDCRLPGRGSGMLTLTAACPRTAAAWTCDGSSHEQRGLKHRPDGAVRMVPVPPVLAAMLRAHSRCHGTAPDGRRVRPLHRRPGPDHQPADRGCPAPRQPGTAPESKRFRGPPVPAQTLSLYVRERPPRPGHGPQSPGPASLNRRIPPAHPFVVFPVQTSV